MEPVEPPLDLPLDNIVPKISAQIARRVMNNCNWVVIQTGFTLGHCSTANFNHNSTHGVHWAFNESVIFWEIAHKSDYSNGIADQKFVYWLVSVDKSKHTQIRLLKWHTLTKILYRIRQKIRGIKFSPIARPLYWGKIFAKFNFANRVRSPL